MIAPVNSAAAAIRVRPDTGRIPAELAVNANASVAGPSYRRLRPGADRLLTHAARIPVLSLRRILFRLILFISQESDVPGLIPQISAAYSAMVRSLENRPMRATLRTVFSSQTW
jgi:hypothetical protein